MVTKGENNERERGQKKQCAEFEMHGNFGFVDKNAMG